MPTSAEIRRSLIDALRLDLIGPHPEAPEHTTELLSQAPSKWYLTGFLVPREAPVEQRCDDSGDDQLDELAKPRQADDDAKPEAASTRKVSFPSSLGLSLLVRGDQPLEVEVGWGDYAPEPSDEQLAAAKEQNKELSGRELMLHTNWRRTPGGTRLPIVPELGTHSHALTDDGLRVVVAAREVRTAGLPTGTRSVSLFLVNDRRPSPDDLRDQSYLFQGWMRVRSAQALVARPDARGGSVEEWDEQVADLQYRNDVEHAVGHNISVRATVTDNACHEVQTEWIPEGTVEKVEAAKPERYGLPADALSMEGLGQAADAVAVRAMVGGLARAYTVWIRDQAMAGQELAASHPQRATIAHKLLARAQVACDRIADGLVALDDPQVFTAFRLANLGMARYARQRFSVERGIPPDELEPPAWRMFQLAFLLMNLRGIAEPGHSERELVDLLFFPTGGGKTEAYLGLAAFTLVLRRLRNPGLSSAGVSVLMRYTLRLLTLDQLGRAAALICALELMRQDDVETLGTWPFEIGLWVGQSATPNRLGKKGDKDQYSARKRTMDYIRDDKRFPSPIPLEKCPWCGRKFTSNSFQLLPNADRPEDLRVVCSGRRCKFKGDNPLPIISVDEPLYRRLPCFIIATIDKFAGLPWVGRTGGLFGMVERHDKAGFYGPCDPGRGTPLPDGPLGRRLAPPELIIQDELHLISGPLGTMAGLYETALDELSTVELDGVRVRPKIVASTATVRRATKQIRALFCRDEVDVFPPPGPDRRDSFFAQTRDPSERNPRLYLGVAAQGRSLKVVLLRSYLALMGAAQRQWGLAGGDKAAPNHADPYMTLMGYFNSLRELGGSRRIVEDEVRSRLHGYGQRRRLGTPAAQASFAKREISYEPLELTSRVPTNIVSDTKRRLERPFHDKKDRVDVALATNMISVGLDITRLGLMVVLGQPKTAAEYIQATSRVGRDEQRPGLVVTLLNVHRPRDRSHYERFESWHSSFYRAVEATSVTPFSPRALDRGLAAVAVALARLGHRDLTAPTRALAMSKQRQAVHEVADVLATRAEIHDRDNPDVEQLRKRVKARVKDILDTWEQIAARNDKTGSGLQYQREEGGAPPLLWNPMDPELSRRPPDERKFKAQRSLRDVEGVTNLWIQNPDGLELGEVD